MLKIVPRELLREAAGRIATGDTHASLYAHQAILAFITSLEGRTFANVMAVGRCFKEEWPEFAKIQGGYPFRGPGLSDGYWLRLFVNTDSNIVSDSDGMSDGFCCGWTAAA